MSEKSGEIVQKVIDKAMDGDVHCLKMCMDRILPVQKAVDSNRAKTMLKSLLMLPLLIL